MCMSCTLGQASDHPSSFLCPLLSVFTLSSFQRTVATNLAKKDQDSRVVLAWRARRSDDAARDGRRQDGSGRLWTERSFRRWTQTRASKPTESSVQLVCQVHRVGSGNDWRPKDVKCQVLSECSEGGSNSSEECSREDEFADGQDSTSKRHVW